MLHRQCRRWIGARKRRGLEPMMTVRMLQHLGRESLKAWAMRDTEELIIRALGGTPPPREPTLLSNFLAQHRA